MKIFLDIGHPAHVHYFKHLIKSMREKGHTFIITARDKEVTHFLLKKENLPFVSRGRGADDFFRKFIYTIKADATLFKIAKSERPDLFLSFASPYCAHVAFLLHKPHIAIDDTETARIGQALYKPFTKIILTPRSFLRDLGKKQVRFPSFMELCYLHKNRFVPDSSIYGELGLKKGDPYVIMRFVAWTANHDFGQSGVTLKNRVKAAEAFSKYAKVFISSENELPSKLQKYKIQISPDRIHHALAFSSLLYGESGTMSSEAAVLGTPAIFVNNLADKLGTLKEQVEKYKLVYAFKESKEGQSASINKGLEILESEKNYWALKRDKLLSENVDMTNYLENFLDNYMGQ